MFYQHNPRRNFTDLETEEIKKLLKNRVPYQIIAEQFDTTERIINGIARRTGLLRIVDRTKKTKLSPEQEAELIRVRQETGLSQAKLAKMFGIDQSTVSAYLRKHGIRKFPYKARTVNMIEIPERYKKLILKKREEGLTRKEILKLLKKSGFSISLSVLDQFLHGQGLKHQPILSDVDKAEIAHAIFVDGEPSTEVALRYGITANYALTAAKYFLGTVLSTIRHRGKLRRRNPYRRNVDETGSCRICHEIFLGSGELCQQCKRDREHAVIFRTPLEEMTMEELQQLWLALVDDYNEIERGPTSIEEFAEEAEDDLVFEELQDLVADIESRPELKPDILKDDLLWDLAKSLGGSNFTNKINELLMRNLDNARKDVEDEMRRREGGYN